MKRIDKLLFAQVYYVTLTILLLLGKLSGLFTYSWLVATATLWFPVVVVISLIALAVVGYFALLGLIMFAIQFEKWQNAW